MAAVLASREHHVVVVSGIDPAARPAWARHDQGYELVELPAGDKWSNAAGLLTSRTDLVAEDGTVWFPDADVQAGPEVVMALFRLHAELGACLSQPSVAGPPRSAGAVEAQHRGLAVRFVDAVHPTAPMFSTDALRRCASTFGRNARGAGLTAAWAALLAPDATGPVIFDCLPVVLGGGPRVPVHDPGPADWSVAVRAGAPLPHHPTLTAVLDADFRAHQRPACLQLALDALPGSSSPATAADPYEVALRQDLARLSHAGGRQGALA